MIRHTPRHAAHLELKALDKVIKARTGLGLEPFGAGSTEGAYPHRTLVLHMDEASVNLSAFCFLAFRKRLRVLFTRDPFHRAWNDAKLALSSTNQFWVTLLCRVVMNVALTVTLGVTSPADLAQRCKKV